MNLTIEELEEMLEYLPPGEPRNKVRKELERLLEHKKKKGPS